MFAGDHDIESAVAELAKHLPDPLRPLARVARAAQYGNGAGPCVAPYFPAQAAAFVHVSRPAPSQGFDPLADRPDGGGRCHLDPRQVLLAGARRGRDARR